VPKVTALAKGAPSEVVTVMVEAADSPAGTGEGVGVVADEVKF